jgi:hypothetical protein
MATGKKHSAMMVLATLAPLHIGRWAGCFKLDGMVAYIRKHKNDYFSKRTKHFSRLSVHQKLAYLNTNSTAMAQPHGLCHSSHDPEEVAN